MFCPVTVLHGDGMQTPSHITLALHATTVLPMGDVPEWVHLLPAGENGRVATKDKRGPYVVQSAARVIENSFALNDRLPIDENHATDLAAPRGEAAPARGWIVEMQAREDGIWGRVEWTNAGRELIADRAYRGISPVIYHDKQNTVHSIARASLVNDPNLRGLKALHQQQQKQQEQSDMDEFLKKLAEALGLSDAATEEEILAAIKTKADAAPEADLAALNAAQTQFAETVLALQQTVTAQAAEIDALKAADTLAKSANVVDAAIAEGRVGVKPLRDLYVSMHQKDPEGVERMIGALPKISGEILNLTPKTDPATEKSLNAAQRIVADALGLSEDEFIAAHLAETKE